MGYRADWVKQIQKDAPRYGLDPRAVLAIAQHEGLSGAVGDGGHAFGPFQLNDAGGAITNRPGDHRSFAESPQGIDWALSQMANAGAKGLTGLAAIQAIATKFERPQNPQAEIQDASAHYGKGLGSGGYIGAQAGRSPGGASMDMHQMVGASQAGSLFQKMLAQQMLQSANNTVQSGQVDNSGLMQMALMRQQANAAQQTFGNGPTGSVGNHYAPQSPNADGYVHPLAGARFGRLDQGIDYQGKPGGRVAAIGKARVDAVKSDPTGFGQAVYYTLLDGPQAGKQVYVGHAQPNVRTGMIVGAGHPVATLLQKPLGNASQPGWTEIGWAQNGAPQSHSEGDHASAANFQSFLNTLGG